MNEIVGIQVMVKKKVVNITEIMEKSPIAKMLAQAETLNRLNDTLQESLPKTFKGYFKVSNLRDNILVLEVGSAVVKQGFKLREKQILAIIQQLDNTITELEIVINPNF